MPDRGHILAGLWIEVASQQSVQASSNRDEAELGVSAGAKTDLLLSHDSINSPDSPSDVAELVYRTSKTIVRSMQSLDGRQPVDVVPTFACGFLLDDDALGTMMVGTSRHSA